MIKYSADKIKKHFVGVFLLLIAMCIVQAIAGVLKVDWLVVIFMALVAMADLLAFWVIIEFLMCLLLCILGLKEKTGMLSEFRLKRAGFNTGLDLESCRGREVRYYHIPTIGIFVEGICCD